MSWAVWESASRPFGSVDGYRVGHFVLGRTAVWFERLQGRYRVSQFVLIVLRAGMASNLADQVQGRCRVG